MPIPTEQEEQQHYQNFIDELTNGIFLGHFVFQNLEFFLYIQSPSWIPDLYAISMDYIGDKELYDNEEFKKSLFSYLKSTGYRGSPFGRCELGMQGPLHAVFEPNEQFEHWVTKLGFQSEESKDN